MKNNQMTSPQYICKECGHEFKFHEEYCRWWDYGQEGKPPPPDCKCPKSSNDLIHDLIKAERERVTKIILQWAVECEDKWVLIDHVKLILSESEDKKSGN